MRKLKVFVTPDVTISLVLFVLGAVTAGVYTATVAQHYGGYTERFGPALSTATLGEFVDIDPSKAADVYEFLNRRGPDVFTSDVKHEATKASYGFQNAHSYLLYLVGLIWRYFGVSWSVLVVIPALFCGTATAGAYAIFRIGCNRWISTILSFLFLFAPFHLSYTNALRDYSKVPFLIWSCFLCAYLVTRTPTKKQLIILSALQGFILGVGRGFRFDVNLGVPFFILCLFVFVYPLRGRFKLKIGALAAFIVVFAVTGLGVRANTTGGATFHVILLGFSSQFNSHIGIDESIYELFSMFGSDAAGWAVVAEHHQRVVGSEAPLQYVSKQHEASGLRYLEDVALMFPADMLCRVYAAVNTSLTEVPFGVFDRAYVASRELGPDPYLNGLRTPTGHLISELANAPRLITNEFLLKLYKWRADMLVPFRGYGTFLVAASILVLSAVNLRISLFCLVFVLYWSGSLALQYDLRHVFHVQFIGLLAVAWLGEAIFVKVKSKEFWLGLRKLREIRYLATLLFRPALFSVTFAVLLFSPLWFLRTLQARNLTTYFEHIAQLPHKDCALMDISGNDPIGLAHFAIPNQVEQLPDGIVDVTYALVEIGPMSGTKNDFAEFSTLYETNMPSHNKNNRTYRIAVPASGSTKVYLPLYSYRVSKYMGHSSIIKEIQVAASSLPYIVRVATVTDINRLPVLPTVILPPNWKEYPLYERIMTDHSQRWNWMLRMGSLPLTFDDALNVKRLELP